MWTSQGLNLGPPDYESVSPKNIFIKTDAKVMVSVETCNY